MVRKSEAGVRFAVKIHQSMTHSRDAGRRHVPAAARVGRAAARGGHVGAVFSPVSPTRFTAPAENRVYLKNLVDRFEDGRGNFSGRVSQRGLARPEVVDAFREMGLTFVSVDYPQVSGMPAPELNLTSGVAYLRLHGRNEKSGTAAKTSPSATTTSTRPTS